MTSSRWDAQGNLYLLTTDPMTPDSVRASVGGADGVLEVLRSGADWVEIAIWNPDGSRAEMSGNGTRIAARWLAERTGADVVSVRVGPREVRAQMLGELVEQDLGEIAVGEPEEVDGIRFTAVDVGNPHAVVEGDPADLPHIGPVLEVHPRFPRRTNGWRLLQKTQRELSGKHAGCLLSDHVTNLLCEFYRESPAQSQLGNGFLHSDVHNLLAVLLVSVKIDAQRWPNIENRPRGDNHPDGFKKFQRSKKAKQVAA